MGEVIYGIVFGKPSIEGDAGIARQEVTWLADKRPSAIDPYAFWAHPWWDWPSDTEPPDESA